MNNQADSLQYIDSESFGLSEIEDLSETDNILRSKLTEKKIDNNKQLKLSNDLKNKLTKTKFVE